jgi:hypothetical protein
MKMSEKMLKLKQFYSDNRWKSRFLIAFLALFFLLLLVRITLPQTVIYSATSWLEKQGIESTIEDISFDFFDGTISLLNAKGSLDGAPLFNIGLVEIHWRWAPLSEKTVEVTNIVLDKLDVKLERYTDIMVVSGIQIPLTTPSDNTDIMVEANKEEVKPWAATLGMVTFTDLDICYLQHGATFNNRNDETRQIDYCVNLGEMIWGGTISYGTDKTLLETEEIPISSTGDFELNGLTVTNNILNRNLLVSTASALHNVEVNGLHDIHIDKLEMRQLSGLQRDDDKHKDALRFAELTVNDINFKQLGELTIKDISLNEPGIYLVRNSETDWEYQQWIPDTGAEQAKESDAESTAADSETKPASEFKLAIEKISVNGADWCHLQKDVSLYYCFTFDSFNWDGALAFNSQQKESGAVNISAKGDVSFLQPDIHNHNIKRSLLNFKSLQLQGVDIADSDTVALSDITLEELSALQRSQKEADYTARFDQLAINDIRYTPNKIAINTVKLSGLENNVSKNKDGSWEHDKWLSKSDKKAAANTQDNKKDKQEDKGKPFLISLNQLLVDSKKKILFTDNSTQPTMVTGLQELKLELKKLYSEKPDTDSPIKLFAQTLKHSTIELEGTARPFAEKVSLDVNGDLKGFDLRVASPAAKKAIGHIIQSGQLDAKLTLLAEEGILNSNIALSLYQFHIKSMSKKDAEKLDQTFGMPLNQTLVLLRNKDDSIHLDIPITGDVNNPEFNPMDAIIKATTKAATVTLVTFYTPYGLIYAGGNVLFDVATALNFDPIPFDPGSHELTTQGKEQLSGLTKLLTEKPQVRLSMCGVTNSKDIFALFPDIKKPKDSSVDIKLAEEQNKKLDELAQQRQVNAKNYLIKESGIGHERLILCAPEHRTEEDAIAGVEINI